jgi:hypothetical protein
MMEFVNGKDDIPCMKWKIKNVPNHQPGLLYHMYEMEHKLIMFETTKRGSR